MTDIELRASAGEVSDNGDYLLDGLPEWMADAEGTGNWKLLDVVGRAFDRVDDDIRSIDAAATVQQAESVDQLKRLAVLTGTKPKNGESLEKYRKRILSNFQLTTCESTIIEILENLSIILDVDIKKIDYENKSSNALEYTVPTNSVQNSPLTSSEVQDIVYKQIAAGFDLQVKLAGTLTYITPSSYSNNNHDASKGYDGLDSNGDPKNNGGTYAGVI